jgi:hypothetical protein
MRTALKPHTKRNEEMNLLELRKKSLAVLLVSFMALGMAACSSSDDPVSDDAASGVDDQPLSCDENDTREDCVNQIL